MPDIVKGKLDFCEEILDIGKEKLAIVQGKLDFCEDILDIGQGKLIFREYILNIDQEKLDISQNKPNIVQAKPKTNKSIIDIYETIHLNRFKTFFLLICPLFVYSSN